MPRFGSAVAGPRDGPLAIGACVSSSAKRFGTDRPHQGLAQRTPDEAHFERSAPLLTSSRSLLRPDRDPVVGSKVA